MTSSDRNFLSIDVLSNGAELSGVGLFLSIWRKSLYAEESVSANQQQETHHLMETSTLLSRYSITGCSCDVLSRAAADQKYSLSSIRSIFCTTNQLSELGHSLPGLLYALQRSGTSSTLSIVSLSPAAQVQELVEILHGRQAYPTVRVCQCPSDADDASPTRWWQVYNDPNLVAHIAVFPSKEGNKENAMVYLFTTLPADTAPSNGVPNSIAYIPESTCDSALATIVNFLSDESLPGIATTRIATVLIRPSTGSVPSCVPTDWLIWQTTTSSKDDDRLLRRARRQTLALREQWRKTTTSNKEITDDYVFPMRMAPPKVGTPQENEQQLQTGASIVFVSVGPASTTGSSSMQPTGGTSAYRLYDRCLPQSTGDTTKDGKGDGNTTKSGDLSGFERFCSVGVPKPIVDENEIDLDDEDGDEASSPETMLQDAQLLVLGTGCASPSPLRGASGYALSLPTQQTIVMEAGEGFCTQWNRHASTNRKFGEIKIIWISHAHWDHYGGLLHLLLRIRESAAHSAAGVAKRRRVDEPPFVVAPTKVLRFLKLVLRDATKEYFREVHLKSSFGISNMCHEFNGTTGDGLIASWDVVKVDHGCEAYGLVLGLNKLKSAVSCSNVPKFMFAFSGDTRPSTEFIRCCNGARERLGLSHVDFMVHEATFDKDGRQMSIKKKHSTINEAFDVAERSKVLRLVLTHFSQRYRRGCEVQEAAGGTIQVLFAVDGMRIKLY